MVTASHLPAPAPSSEMAGAMSPRMISGITKPRKLPNSPLTVTKTRVSQSGKKSPQTMPSTMAMMILGSRPMRRPGDAVMRRA